MPFSTVDSLVNALNANGKGQFLRFHKTMAQASVANIPTTLWKATGIPAAGTSTTNGPANGRTPTSSTTGAFTYTNATGPATMALVRLGWTSMIASTTGSLILVDRMADCNLNNAQATSAITGLDGSSRCAATTAPGDGGQIWTEVTSALSAASNTITYSSYTNQLGTAGQSSQGVVTTASAVVGRSLNANLWQGLATGDTGVRSIQNLTLTAGTATGAYDLCIVRPLGYIPCQQVATWVDRDFVVEVPNLQKLFDSTCFMFIYVPTAAVTGTIFGEFAICQN